MSTVLETRARAFADASKVPLSLASALPTLRAVAPPVLRRTMFTTPDSRIPAVATAAPGPMDGGWTTRVRPRPKPCSDVASVRG